MMLERAMTFVGGAVLLLCVGCLDPAGVTTSGEESTGTGTSTGDAPTTGGASETSAAESTGGESGDTSGGESSTGGPVEPPEYEKWLKVEIPGTVCGNNSQYKFFVNYKEGAKDLTIMLEPGGACWDYDGCSGKTDLGAAHPDGISDDLMKYGGQNANISPLIRRDLE